MDEMFDADLVSVLGNHYQDATTERTASAQPKKAAHAVKPQAKKETALDASWKPVAERSFIQKLESAVKGMAIPLISYLVFWAWLESGMMETVPAIICMSISMLVLGFNVREALK